jgi:hypothetical protein
LSPPGRAAKIESTFRMRDREPEATKETDVRMSLQSVSLHLRRGATMRLDAARGATLRVRRGRVWLTEQGLRDDVFLDAGQSWRLRRPGRAVVQAEASSEFELVSGAAQPIAEADLACARSTCFWIFPVDVFGTGPKRTSRGTL